MKIKLDKKTVTPEFEYFLNTPLTQYEGQYVAIIGQKVVSSGESAKVVWNQARKKYPKFLPTIAKIPKKETTILN